MIVRFDSLKRLILNDSGRFCKLSGGVFFIPSVFPVLFFLNNMTSPVDGNLSVFFNLIPILLKTHQLKVLLLQHTELSSLFYFEQ